MLGGRELKTQERRSISRRKEQEISSLLKKSPLGLANAAKTHERSRSIKIDHNQKVVREVQNQPLTPKRAHLDSPEKDYGRYYAKPQVDPSGPAASLSPPRSSRKMHPLNMHVQIPSKGASKPHSYRIPEYEEEILPKGLIALEAHTPTKTPTGKQVVAGRSPLSPEWTACQLLSRLLTPQILPAVPQIPPLLLCAPSSEHVRVLGERQTLETDNGGLSQGFVFLSDTRTHRLTWMQTGTHVDTLLFSGGANVSSKEEKGAKRGESTEETGGAGTLRVFGEAVVGEKGFRGFWDREGGFACGPGVVWAEGAKMLVFGQNFDQNGGIRGVGETRSTDAKFQALGVFSGVNLHGVGFVEHIEEFKPERALYGEFNPLIPSHWETLKYMAKQDGQVPDPYRESKIYSKATFLGDFEHGIANGSGMVCIDLISLPAQLSSQNPKSVSSRANPAPKTHERLTVAGRFRDNQRLQDGYAWIKKDLYVDDRQLLSKENISLKVDANFHNDFDSLRAINYSEYRGQLKNSLKEGIGYFRMNLTEVYRNSMMDPSQTSNGKNIPKKHPLLTTILPLSSNKSEFVKFFGQFVRDHIHGFGILINEQSGEFLIGEFRKGELFGDAVLFQDKQIVHFESETSSPTGVATPTASRTPQRKKSAMGEDIPLAKQGPPKMEQISGPKPAKNTRYSDRHPNETLARTLGNLKQKVFALSEALGTISEGDFDIGLIENQQQTSLTNWQIFLASLSKLIWDNETNQTQLKRCKKMVDAETVALERSKQEYWYRPRVSNNLGLTPKMEAFYQRKMNLPLGGHGGQLSATPQIKDTSLRKKQDSPGSGLGSVWNPESERSFRSGSLRKRDRSGLRKMTQQSPRQGGDALNLPQSPPSHTLGMLTLSPNSHPVQSTPPSRTQEQLLELSIQTRLLLAVPLSRDLKEGRKIQFAELGLDLRDVVSKIEEAVDRIAFGSSQTTTHETIIDLLPKLKSQGFSTNRNDSVVQRSWLGNNAETGSDYGTPRKTKIGEELPSKQSATPASKYLMPESAYDKVGRVELNKSHSQKPSVVKTVDSSIEVPLQIATRDDLGNAEFEQRIQDKESTKGVIQKPRVKRKFNDAKSISFRRVDPQAEQTDPIQEFIPQPAAKIRRTAAQRKEKTAVSQDTHDQIVAQPAKEEDHDHLQSVALDPLTEHQNDKKIVDEPEAVNPPESEPLKTTNPVSEDLNHETGQDGQQERKISGDEFVTESGVSEMKLVPDFADGPVSETIGQVDSQVDQPTFEVVTSHISHTVERPGESPKYLEVDHSQLKTTTVMLATPIDKTPTQPSPSKMINMDPKNIAVVEAPLEDSESPVLAKTDMPNPVVQEHQDDSISNIADEEDVHLTVPQPGEMPEQMALGDKINEDENSDAKLPIDVKEAVVQVKPSPDAEPTDERVPNQHPDVPQNPATSLVSMSQSSFQTMKSITVDEQPIEPIGVTATDSVTLFEPLQQQSVLPEQSDTTDPVTREGNNNNDGEETSAVS